MVLLTCRGYRSIGKIPAECLSRKTAMACLSARHLAILLRQHALGAGNSSRQCNWFALSIRQGRGELPRLLLATPLVGLGQSVPLRQRSIFCVESGKGLKIIAVADANSLPPLLSTALHPPSASLRRGSDGEFPRVVTAVAGWWSGSSPGCTIYADSSRDGDTAFGFVQLASANA